MTHGNPMPMIGDRDRLDVDHIGHVVPFGDAIRRRIDGNFPVDPFGFDPHLVDLVSPLFSGVIRVDVEGGDHLPITGPASIVANRGFGIAAVAFAEGSQTVPAPLPASNNADVAKGKAP